MECQYVSIHHFDEPRTPETGTSFGVTDLLCEYLWRRCVVIEFRATVLGFQPSFSFVIC